VGAAALLSLDFSRRDRDRARDEAATRRGKHYLWSVSDLLQTDSPAAAEAPQLTFADLGLSPQVMKALADVGYESPSAVQAQTIPPLLEGRHVVGLAQTGTGKTAAFALPILSQLDMSQKTPQALVLAPTRELALQVSEAFERYGAHMKGVRVLPIYGGQGYGVQLSALRRGVHVVVGTPGRIMDHLEKGTLGPLRAALPGARRGRRDAEDGLRRGRRDDPRRHPDDKHVALFSATMPPDPADLEEVPRTTRSRSRSRTRPRPAPTPPSATSSAPTPRRSTRSPASSRSRTSRG
jgi:ATP-dependent RNA helicase DeaD